MARDLNISFKEARRRIGISFSEIVKRNTASPPSTLFTPGPHTVETDLNASTNLRPNPVSRDMNILKSQFASLRKDLEDIRVTSASEVKELKSTVFDLYDR